MKAKRAEVPAGQMRIKYRVEYGDVVVSGEEIAPADKVKTDIATLLRIITGNPSTSDTGRPTGPRKEGG